MKLKNLLVVFAIINITSCKTILRCNMRNSEMEIQKNDQIKANAEAALRDYYSKNDSVTARKISSINIIDIDDVTDSIKVSFEVNRFKDPLPTNPEESRFTSDSSVWFYKVENKTVYITKLSD
jgi:hypothetical protein